MRTSCNGIAVAVQEDQPGEDSSASLWIKTSTGRTFIAQDDGSWAPLPVPTEITMDDELAAALANIELLPGPAGVDGTNGKDGVDGKDGADGYTPVKGVDYFDGTQGEQGIQGNTGQTGQTGQQGQQGLKGDTGEQGIPGIQGIQGIKGDKGDTGDISAAYPVGSVYMSILDTNPATLLGIGTWVRIASGQFLIGQKSADADFDVAEEQGGTKTHTHPDHPALTHTGTAVADHAAGVTGTFAATSKLGSSTANTATIGHNHTTPALVHDVTQPSQHSAQGHDSPSNVPPYFVVYMWKRTVQYESFIR